MSVPALADARLRIARLDLRGVHADLMKNEGYTPERATRAVQLYRQFLELCAEFPDASLAPPTAADKAWHQHILDSRRYMTDSIAIFGGYVHHDPEAFGTAAFHRSWTLMQTLYAERYGVALPDVDDEAGDPDLRAYTCVVLDIEPITRLAA